MLGFSNAFYDETKMINNIKFGYEEEQIIDDNEPKDWQHPITSATRQVRLRLLEVVFGGYLSAQSPAGADL